MAVSILRSMCSPLHQSVLPILQSCACFVAKLHDMLPLFVTKDQHSPRLVRAAQTQKEGRKTGHMGRKRDRNDRKRWGTIVIGLHQRQYHQKPPRHTSIVHVILPIRPVAALATTAPRSRQTCENPASQGRPNQPNTTHSSV